MKLPAVTSLCLPALHVLQALSNIQRRHNDAGSGHPALAAAAVI